jgi:tripartite-type tricarboxylate transporter receptor subunit TctC
MMPFRLARIARYAAVALAIQAGAAVAQGWPTHQIVVVSPFFAGTTYDLVARLVLDQVARQIGQPFVLENRPGDGGSVAVASVVKAAPDGYTLLLSTSAMVTAVILHKSLPYDALRDLEPVALFGGEPSALLAAPGKGYSTVDALVAAAKANPGKLKFASTGIGSAAHLAGERFRLVAGLEVQHAIYTDPTQALNDLTAGRIDFYFVPITPALALAAQGKAAFLGVTTTGRWPPLPSVPTLAETGYAIDTFLTWCGLSAPANTPPEIVNKLNKAIGNAMDLPAIQDRLQRMGFKPTAMEPDQYGQFFADDIATTIKLGKDANIKPKD